MKPRLMSVTEALGAARMRRRAAQEKRGQSRKKTSGDDHAFPNDAGCKNLRCRRTKRRKQNHQGRLANPYATLRDRHDCGDFGKWPREEPHTQRHIQATSKTQESSEQNIGALHGCSQQPAKKQPLWSARDRTDRMAKLREPAPETNGPAAQ